MKLTALRTNDLTQKNKWNKVTYLSENCETALPYGCDSLLHTFSGFRPNPVAADCMGRLSGSSPSLLAPEKVTRGRKLGRGESPLSLSSSFSRVTYK